MFVRPLLPLVVFPMLFLTACNSSPPAATPGRPGPVPPSTNAAMAPCRHVDVGALAAVRPVRLDPLRSTSDAPVSGATSVTCVFTSPDGSVQVGSITLTRYPSAAAAEAALKSGVAAAQGLGLSVTQQDGGGANSFAEQVPNGWTCALVSGTLAVEATVATTDSPAACGWGRAGLAGLAGAG